MPRYFLELAYKGTAYSGFQVQPGRATVQSEVEKALQVLFKQAFELTGSSRTDAGVHAKQNFFHFDTGQAIYSRQLYNLNALLPPDIVVKGIYRVPETAHSRFDAVSREYQYFIYHSKDPFLTDRAWRYPYPLDRELLQQAAVVVAGHRDFTSFSKRNTQVKTFLCTIEHSEWTVQGGRLVYTVRANRFLRGMVRGLVGTMLKVGRKQLSINELNAIIEARDCALADFSSPAQGLFLAAVNYPEALTRQFLPLNNG
ncbi:tRNA pseudouridine(38-40) synthase TruA [Sediminibacterium soli]|uniref:tRNA pseudouridine(38-40) synthase TruA n=1 Tax=Sediminibacterium soli TaxID=2698829 RepID=UPI001379EE68|nr:tRNA pseudouridine(38-40) synthase TruA [Sediminibacterium soli]NCI47175.1 tRNA pseudouridine(38-40) synthase TruA [Sediminibacterium soli]